MTVVECHGVVHGSQTCEVATGVVRIKWSQRGGMLEEPHVASLFDSGLGNEDGCKFHGGFGRRVLRQVDHNSFQRSALCFVDGDGESQFEGKDWPERDLSNGHKHVTCLVLEFVGIGVASTAHGFGERNHDVIFFSQGGQ